MTIQVVASELLRKERPVWAFKEGVNLADHVVAITTADKKTVHEFIGTDDFAAAFYERQEYEVDAGRDEEPLLYQSLYSITEDRNLPRNVPVNRVGPAGVVFEKVEEGGEVKFATVGQSNFSVPIYHYSVGLEYDDDLVEFNELWNLSEVERQAGTAYNALLNNIHLSPILTHTYAAKNQTDGTAITYDTNALLPEKYLRAMEQAIIDAVGEASDPRREPYELVISTANLFTMERALTIVPQQGITLQSSALSRIRRIIAYDGWTGTMGQKTTTYSGVAAGTAYLVDVGQKARNMRSYVKHGLRRTMGNPDVSRFILEQTVWDSRLGTYADIAAGVQEVTLPIAS